LIHGARAHKIEFIAGAVNPAADFIPCGQAKDCAFKLFLGSGLPRAVVLDIESEIQLIQGIGKKKI
jgi:hypothetical protein